LEDADVERTETFCGGGGGDVGDGGKESSEGDDENAKILWSSLTGNLLLLFTEGLGESGLSEMGCGLSVSQMVGIGLLFLLTRTGDVDEGSTSEDAGRCV